MLQILFYVLKAFKLHIFKLPVYVLITETTFFLYCLCVIFVSNYVFYISLDLIAHALFLWLNCTCSIALRLWRWCGSLMSRGWVVITPRLPSGTNMTCSGVIGKPLWLTKSGLVKKHLKNWQFIVCRNKLAIDYLIEDHQDDGIDPTPQYPPHSLFQYMEFLTTFDPLIQHCLVSC